MTRLFRAKSYLSTPTAGLDPTVSSTRRDADKSHAAPYEPHDPPQSPEPKTRSHQPKAPSASARNRPSNATKPGSPDHKNDEELDVKERTKPVVPRRYKVLFHNDSYTTMEFVVECLITFFHKSETEATHVMLTVHRMGAATAGIYTREVAETKVQQVMDHARKNGMPLMLTAEPE